MSPRLSFYADDFTGATDALESLTQGGVRTVLFISPPKPADLAATRDADAVGVAGRTRTMDRGGLEAELSSALDALRALDAPLCHYKVCSTFDSSPLIGSVGAAIEVGLEQLGGSWVPLLVGAPALGRWTAFGTHFARVGADGPVLRLDRHPIADHPVTPMKEADLLAHLARQTGLPSGLVATELAGGAWAGEQVRALRSAGTRVILFDVASERDLAHAGEVIDAAARAGEVRFVVGSSGVGSALTLGWASAGDVRPDPLPAAEPARRVAAFSGSCSSVTAGQIEWAVANGWVDVPLDVPGLVSGQRERALERASERIERAGVSRLPFVVHSAQGPDDARVAAAAACAGPAEVEEAVSAALGELAAAQLKRGRLDRVVVTGGDTCGAVARKLGIRSVRAVAQATRGAPLCVADSTWSAADGLEFVFKAGGLGEPGFLGRMQAGTSRVEALS